MKKQITAVLTFGLVAMAGQAQTKWTGFKAGATLGSTRYEAVWTDTSYDWFGGNLSHPKRVFTPGIHGGYDFQMGSVVYGAEVDFTHVGAKQEVAYSTQIGDPADVVKTDELKYVATLRGRMGLIVGDGLVYATAGLAKVKAEHTWVEDGDVDDSWPRFSNGHMGFVWGFGLEHRLNKMISVRAEYQHVDVPAAKLDNLNGYYMEVSELVSSFRVGASFHF
jgi:opacity protein-like surface antigen